MGNDLRSSFERDGLAFVPGLFGPDVLPAMRAEFDVVVDRLLASGEDVNARWDSAGRHEDAGRSTVVHTHHVQNHSAVWLWALLHEPFLDAVEALIGPDIVLHHSKLFQKPPGEGAPFPMHQDWRYFPTERDSMIAAVIHLSPATVDMGCIRAVPGSHRIGRRGSTSGRVIWDDPEAFAAFADEYPLTEAVPFEAEPGDVLFFSYLSVHGSGPNRSPDPRKTVLVQLFSGADRLDPSSEHPVSGLVLRGRNHHATRHSVGRT